MKQGGPLKRGWRFLQEPTEDERSVQLRSIHGGQPLVSRARHQRWRIYAAIYLAVWFVGLILALSAVHGWWRLLVASGFMLITPTLGDITQSYDDYRREWEIGNSDREAAEPSP